MWSVIKGVGLFEKEKMANGGCDLSGISICLDLDLDRKSRSS